MKPHLFLALLPVVLAVAAEPPRRLDRSDAFLGIHFDFHAGPDCTNVGARTTHEMVNGIIDRVHPDYLQIDCKGHPGYASYPTKLGNAVPGFVGDPLRVWREATRARGVGLFMHYSGVWDSRAVKTHPAWAAVDGSGKPNGKATSVFGPYVDELMIPQMRELAGDYGVDGIWVDGDCWGTVPDYGAKATAAFRAQFHADPPKKRGEPLWNEWRDFHREGFRAYVRRYVDALKSSHPAFEVISNWAFSDHMPEPVTANVASLSGDFSPDDSVNSARFAGRCMENQGRPWDLMAWSFNRSRAQKPALQLQQEAAIVLALGGGFQAYFKQNRDGSIRDMADMDTMAEVAKFCRERQAFCHKAQPVPQVAVLYSRASHYRSPSGLFHPGGDPGVDSLKATLRFLLAWGRSVQVVSEHHLAGHMAEWPLIVVPSWNELDSAFRDELAAYAKAGGQLLLVSATTLGQFTPELGVSAFDAQGSPVLKTVGKGRIGAVPAANDLAPLLLELAPTPMVEVAGPGDVDVSIRRLKGRLMVNLVNTSGDHANDQNRLVTAIPPAGPLKVAMRLAKEPRAVTLEPGGTKLAVAWTNGVAHVTIPSLAIHSILAVDE